LKLLLDEMYPSLIARELRARGHDVASVHESPGSRTSSEGRAVLTENVALLAAGDSHGGIVFSTPEQPVDAELWL